MKKYNGFLFIIMALNTLIIHAHTMTVVIASKSRQKISAVKEFFNEKFPDNEILYISHQSFSLIPEQPVGVDCALQGARNRLYSLPVKLLEADFVVCIENYIEQSCETLRWYDIGLIVIKQPEKETVVISKSTFIPDLYVQLAQKMSTQISELGYSTTVGIAIQQSFAQRDIDPSDWHREPEFGGISRQQLLKDALNYAKF